MTIIIDSHIPFIAETIQRSWSKVDIYPMESEEIDASAVKEADILIVRTRTKVNEALLAGSRVHLVCTATVGFDHIDTAYCESHGIRWMACPGCNAQAVCDYIEEAIKEVYNNPFCEFGKVSAIGIVGVGNVGGKVAEMAKRNKFNVFLYDPPKGLGNNLDYLAKNCDIITFHVPLDKSTYHMCDAAFLAKCNPNTLIINAARGGVVDEEALLKSGHPYIIDTWENEPKINQAVLAKALRASMHIAGYSIEGKRNASQMCLDTIAETFGFPKITIHKSKNKNPGDASPGWLSRITDSLKANPAAFEALRKAYPLRGV